MAKRRVWRMLYAGWRPVLTADFWLWTFPKQPLHSLGIVLALCLTSYIDIRELRLQGERMD
jgi:hypothetical protein